MIRVLAAPSNYRHAERVLQRSRSDHTSLVQWLIPPGNLDPLCRLERIEYKLYGRDAQTTANEMLVAAPAYLPEEVWFTEALIAATFAGLRTHPRPHHQLLVDGVTDWAVRTPHWRRHHHPFEPYPRDIATATEFCSETEPAEYTAEPFVCDVVASALDWFTSTDRRNPPEANAVFGQPHPTR